MAIRYKNDGRYAYETHNTWNKEKKKYETKWTYLGVVRETGEFKKAYANKVRQENMILNYGDSFILNEFCNKSGLSDLVRSVFGNLADSIFALVFFKFLEQSAMQHAETWFDGNYAKMLFPDVDLSSPNISSLLKSIGDERLHRAFFKSYLEKLYSKKGVIIDSTGLPNDISFSLSALGHHGGRIEKETRLLMVIDKEKSEPLYFRYMPGNIVDVSTLKNTIEELVMMGVKAEMSLIDAGYCSEGNIRLLYENRISFLTRLPAGRVLFSSLIENTVGTLETPVNAVIFDERVLYIQKVNVELYDEYQAYAYVCCDITRRADETVKCLKTGKEDGLAENELIERLKRKGIFVLLSSDDVAVTDVLPLYYMRQAAEEIFKISKSYADILPLRVHSEQTFRGVLFLNFLAVVLYINLRGILPLKIHVESAIKLMRNLMCKVFDDNSVLPSEPNKKQKAILESINNTVGKF